MARSFAVYRAEDREFIERPPKDVYSQEFESWEAECWRRRLCEGPLGSEGVIRVYWSEPAQRLRLPLIASIYDDGFYRGCDWSGPDLDRLATELYVLTAYWRQEGLEDLPWLEERADGLRKGIDIARGAR